MTRRAFIAAWLLALLAGIACGAEVPAANVPPALRQENWSGRVYDPVARDYEGSCVHATLITALRWQDQDAMADWWRAAHDSGESASGLAGKLDTAGVRYAMTCGEGDVAFLEWAIATRRACGVSSWVFNDDGQGGGYHVVLLVHLDATTAGIIDPNAPKAVQWYTRESFLEHWRASLSWAFAPVYSPYPPLPEGR